VLHLLLQVSARQQLHYQVDAVLVVEETVQARDVLVLQERLDFYFPQQTVFALVFRNFLLGQDLDHAEEVCPAVDGDVGVPEGSTPQQSNQLKILDGPLFDSRLDVNLNGEPSPALLLVFDCAVVLVAELVLRNALLHHQFRQVSLGLDKGRYLHVLLLRFLQGVCFGADAGDYEVVGGQRQRVGGFGVAVVRLGGAENRFRRSAGGAAGRTGDVGQVDFGNKVNIKNIYRSTLPTFLFLPPPHPRLKQPRLFFSHALPGRKLAVRAPIHGVAVGAQPGCVGGEFGEVDLQRGGLVSLESGIGSGLERLGQAGA
jgi:hypothetical protein